MCIKGWRRVRLFGTQIEDGISFGDLAYTTEIVNGYQSDLYQSPLKADRHGIYHIAYKA